MILNDEILENLKEDIKNKNIIYFGTVYNNCNLNCIEKLLYDGNLYELKEILQNGNEIASYYGESTLNEN